MRNGSEHTADAFCHLVDGMDIARNAGALDGYTRMDIDEKVFNSMNYNYKDEQHTEEGDMLIAIEGLDGMGKTTLARDLKARLEKEGNEVVLAALAGGGEDTLIKLKKVSY